MEIIFLFSLLGLTLGNKQLFKNSPLTVFVSDDIYFNIYNFKAYDILNFEVSCPNNCPSSLTIYYSESTSSTAPYYYSNINKAYGSKINYYTTNYYFSITLSGNNYLLLKINDLLSYTIQYTGMSSTSTSNNSSKKKDFSIETIFVGGGAFVILVCIVIIIIWCKRKSTSVIHDPLVSDVYVQPVYPPTYQIQPAYPY